MYNLRTDRRKDMVTWEVGIQAHDNPTVFANVNEFRGLDTLQRLQLSTY
jgi:hypothetical protein